MARKQLAVLCINCGSTNCEYPYRCYDCDQGIPEGDPESIWELYYVDSGKTERLTLKECQEKFGKAEFLETAQGYAPHIVASQV